MKRIQTFYYFLHVVCVKGLSVITMIMSQFDTIFFIFVHIGFPVFVSQAVAFSAGMLNSFLWNRLMDIQSMPSCNNE